MKKTFLYILIAVSFSACEKKTDWPLETQQSNLIVVDGIITGELKTQSLKLSFPVTELNASPVPVTGAAILISNEDSVFHLTEQPEGSGVYKSIVPFQAREGKNYSLLIFYGDQVLSAKSAMVPGSLFSFLVYSKNEETGLYRISWVASSFSTGNPALWEVLLDWSNVPGYQQSDPASCKARLLFYTLPTLDVSQIFAPAVEEVSFPAGTTINETRYSLTPEHAEFIREVLLETQWTGGIFNSIPANVPTNLSSGGAGFFAVCGVYTISQTVPQKK
ncbi:MAG: DUF4249 family protein [Bacteroidetes bacterium]|nr:DUF4249 family protein [Bacteroidota bacterium]